jgi:hypothetical protein
MVEDQRVVHAFLTRANLGAAPTLCEVIEAIRRIPYGRPKTRSPQGVVSEWRGTCSTKHALLARLLTERWPEIGLQLVHRVYRLTPETARRTFGTAIGRLIPAEGLTDVHTYAVLIVNARRMQVDVTFPGEPWDGRSDIPLACSAGRDVVAGHDPWAEKEALVREHCDPRIREPFLAALADDDSMHGEGPHHRRRAPSRNAPTSHATG